MIGLIFLFAFAVYLGLSILVVRLAMRWARANGRRAKRWGVAAGLIMYLLVFWDHIPTIVLHKYYCATKTGLWVNKTPEQWKIENSGVAETLTWRENCPQYQASGVTRGNILNERFAWVESDEHNSILPVTVTHESIIDLQKNSTVVYRITVSSGYGSIALGGKDWRVVKSWVGAKICNPYKEKFGELRREFWMMGRKAQ